MADGPIKPPKPRLAVSGGELVAGVVIKDGLEDETAEERLERLILIHNEKTKITSTAVSSTAVTLFGGGVVLPVVALSFPLAAAPPAGQVTFVTMIVWGLVALALHWKARSMLQELR